MAVIRNTFEGRMTTDALAYAVPKGSYLWAKNAVHQDRKYRAYGGLASEEGNKKVYDFGGAVKGDAYVESVNSSFYFVGNTIHMFNHTTMKGQVVASASEFGCEWASGECEYIRPTFKTMQPCNELHMYWSQGCEYYTMNITEMLDPIRKEALKSCIAQGNEDGCGYTCEYFKLMKATCTPRISPIISDGGGHSLENGIYQFAAQLEDRSGNTTNWSWVSDPISVGGMDNIAGQRSHQSIDVNISDLDCKYSRIRIAVVKTIGNVKTQEVVAERGYSTDGITFNYTGQFVSPLESLTEITAKKKTYIRGRELIQKDGRLWLYKIRQEKNPDMQRRVSDSAQLSFIETEVTARMAEKYNMRSLQGGERYLPAVVYNFTDNTHTAAFLITNGGGGGGGGSTLGSTEGARSTGDTSRASNAADVGAPTPSPTGDEPSGRGREYVRKRGKPDQPASADNADSSVVGATENWDTNMGDFINSMNCDDCQEPFCCNAGECIPCTPESGLDNDCEGCQENEEAAAADGPLVDNVLTSNVDELSSASQDHAEMVSSGSMKEAADNFVKKAVENAEYVERKKAQFNINSKIGGTRTVSKSTGILYADEYVNGKGESLIEGNVRTVAIHEPIVRFSTEVYPDGKNCNGEPLYGGLAGTPVRLFETPTIPFIVPGVQGVPSRENPALDPIYNNKLRLLGIQVEGVPMPTSEEEEIEWFGKPLCKNQPYRIVMVQRDHANSTVQAKALITGTFQGVSNGKTYAIPRNGLNGPTLLDRFINDGGSRAGTDGGFNIYNAHGLDTNILKVGLSATKFRLEGICSGIGHRYGLYAEGEKPDNRLTGNRKDRRGYRGAVNVNSFAPASGEFDIVGLSYAPADSVVQAPDGVSADLLNRYRESSVYFELSGSLGLDVDKSMIADGLDHEAPIKSANAAYGAFIREIPDQYGSVVGMKFIDTGIVAHGSSGGNVKGIVGDIYVGPNVFKRTSYLSDKVGDTYPLAAAGYERDRTVCDSPDDALFQQLGVNHYATRLPESGDKSDARNWANSFYGMDREPADWSTAADIGFTGIDIYYPKTQTTLVYSFTQSRVNPWLRATGLGDDDVFVPKLKRWYLDANSEDKHPAEESFLSRFCYLVTQPSLSQLLKVAFVKIILASILPTLGILLTTQLESVPDSVGYFMGMVTAIAQWQFYKRVFTREMYLHKMFGLPVCYTDSEGGEEDNNIVGFEDNLWSYDSTHSKQNEANIYFSMPLVYNTCDCDECANGMETTNEIFFSNKQMEGSPFDAYKNFKAFNYTEISADSGRLEDLFVWNGALYAQTTDATHLVKFAPVTTQTSTGAAILGGNDLLIDPQIYLEGIQEGFAGTADPKASITCPLGRVYIDRPAGKVYVFDGQGHNEISSIGMFNFWKDLSEYCGDGECQGYKKAGTDFFSIGWDPRFNRLLITKNDREEPFTLSYDPFGRDIRGWISFHDYIPQTYIWDRTNMYTIKDGGLWLHNVPGQDCKFYDEQYDWGVQFPAYITRTSGELDEFTYASTTLKTEAKTNNGLTLDKTFDKVAAWNNHQGTGTRTILTISDDPGSNENAADIATEYPYISAQTERRKFVIDRLTDNLKKTCSKHPLTLQEDCQPYEEINESIFDCSPEQAMNNRGDLRDDFLVYRFTGTPQDFKMKLLEVATEIEL
jgi:hypothetical protein